MTPEQLVPSSFAAYPPMARRYALQYLPLLTRLPLAICPSFLQQLRGMDTSFPAEQAAFRWQCETLQSLPAGRLEQLFAPLAALRLSDDLRRMNWVQSPEKFITDLSAYLWSSGQLNQFRTATRDLFAAIPEREDPTHRLVFVAIGQGAKIDGGRVLRKLRPKGVFLTALDHRTAFADARAAMLQHQQPTDAPYASWYIDGGTPQVSFSATNAGMTVITYPQLAGVRERVLARMQAPVSSAGGGAEQMQLHLTETSTQDVGVSALTNDPVLQRFYTELFTLSSGPQIFSTSFVQWTGRELARRAQPQTLFLRYAPRRSYQDMNQMLSDASPASVDAQGSLIDAEMGAYYNWIEMNRISAPGKLTFAVWVEDHPFALIVSPNAPAMTVCSTPLTLQQALKNFG